VGWLWVGCAGVLGCLGLVYVLGSRPWRALPDAVCEEIAAIPARRPNQHVVDLELRDGSRLRKVWIAYGNFPAVLGGRTITRRFRPRDVIHAHPLAEQPRE
jgi:hypothetical protein